MEYEGIALAMLIMITCMIISHIRAKRKDVVMKTQEDDFADRIAQIITYDYELMENEKSHADIMARYEQLLDLGKREGFTPVIVVPDDRMYEILESTNKSDNDEYNLDTIIGTALALDPKEVLAELLAENIQSDENDEEYDYLGVYEKSDAVDSFLSLTNIKTMLPYEKLMILKLPTRNPWEAAAWIPMGGFNDCPGDEELVAVFKYWYEKYGAVPAVAGVDTWEMYVEEPLTDVEEAKELALAQYGFCGDIVWQGVEHVNALAGSIIDSKVWFFWWD